MLVNIFLLVACDLSQPAEPSPSGNDQNIDNTNKEVKPQEGGQLRIPVQGLESWNPLIAKTTDSVNFLSLIYEGLVGYDSDLKKSLSLHLTGRYQRMGDFGPLILEKMQNGMMVQALLQRMLFLPIIY